MIEEGVEAAPYEEIESVEEGRVEKIGPAEVEGPSLSPRFHRMLDRKLERSNEPVSTPSRPSVKHGSDAVAQDRGRPCARVA